MLKDDSVVVWDAGVTEYPKAGPFHPSERYPEYPFDALGPENRVYGAVRETLRSLGLDAERFGDPEWDPLGELVCPGNTVIVKPNFVVSEHPLGQPGVDAAVVHGSVLRPIIDYVWIALRGQGRVLVADSPIKEVDFDRIVALTGIASIRDFYAGQSPSLQLMDFRDLYVRRDEGGIMVEDQPLPGDPTGYTPVDLGAESLFHEIGPHLGRLRSTAVYYENVMGEFHNERHHVYSVPNTLLNTDVVISVAKLKTHRKGGVTLSLKNAVGITNEKRGLPHHRVGSPSQGGDAVADNARWDARLEDSFRDLMLRHASGRVGLKLLGRPLKAVARGMLKPAMARLSPDQVAVVEGDWYGNDTVWRMALDLNQVLAYADQHGRLQETPQRRYLSLVDGIVAGEGEGPLFPTPKPCGVLLAGSQPVVVDLVGTRLMGFDPDKVPMIREGFKRHWRLRPAVSPEDVQVISNLEHRDGVFDFEPCAGWRGHIELTARPSTGSG